MPESRWSNVCVAAAVRRNIIFPSEIGQILGANEPITREEATVWMVRALGIELGGEPLEFADRNLITFSDEIATAVDIGLITGMPGNLFSPTGTTTRAQAAVLITRMLDVYGGSIDWDEDEMFHYVYRSDVVVINQPPIYSVVESSETFTITINNPTSDINGLSVGDTFVFESTAQNPCGIAGHVRSVTRLGERITIIADIPESLDEIFYEFEFTGQIDALAADAEIIIAEELSGLSGIEVSRNPTSHVSARLSDLNVRGMALNGELRMYSPRIRASFSRNNINYLVVATAVQLNVNASAEANINTVIPLFSIRVPFTGGRIDIPVGLRVDANGHFSLDFTCRIDADFGIRNNRPSAQANLRYALDFELSARAALSINIQARARIAGVGVYGIQGDFGMGVQTSATMQGRCPVRSCFVVELFHVRSVSSIRGWGLFGDVGFLRFDLDLAPSGQPGFRYRVDGRWHTSCPCTVSTPPSMGQQRPQEAPPADWDSSLLEIRGAPSSQQTGTTERNDSNNGDERDTSRSNYHAQTNSALTYDAKMIAVSIEVSVLRNDGTVWIRTGQPWAYFSLPEGFKVCRCGITQVRDLDRVISISMSQWSTFALRNDGTVWAINTIRSCSSYGDEQSIKVNYAMQVQTPNRIVAISAYGETRLLALRDDGTMWVGRRDSIFFNQIRDERLSDVVAISTAVTSTPHHALRSDGTVWSFRTDGRSTGDVWGVKQISNLYNVIEISAAIYRSIALMEDGTVWAWDSSGAQQGVAYQVQDLYNIVSVRTTGSESFALRDDGTVWAWTWFPSSQPVRRWHGATIVSRTPAQVTNLYFPIEAFFAD